MDKNYEPEVMPETPFPGEPIILPTQTQPSAGGNYNPTTTKEKTFPKKRTAVELLSTALNTKSKKILQEFALQDSGGFKVGDFKSGVSGDLRITPNGLTARNISGITTFAIDGDTGDAIFKGEVRGEDFIIADGTGLKSLSNFQVYSDSGSPIENYDSTSYVNITGASISFELERNIRAIAIISVLGSSEQVDPLDAAGSSFLRLNDNLNGELVELRYDAFRTQATNVRENFSSKNYSNIAVVSLDAGIHTVTLQGKITGNTNMVSTVNSFNMYILALGS